MDQKLDHRKIEFFWEWFVGNEARIRDVVENYTPYDREVIVHELDNQILEFGMFTWEIGHGFSRSYYLTISPNGDQEMLARSRLIMKSAPDLTFWEFYHARPVKDWDLIINLYDDMMNEHHINASEWKFILSRGRNNRINVLIEASNMGHLDNETKWTAGNMVVISLIGEECRINEVNKIDIIDKFEDQHKDTGSPIVDLKQYLDKLLERQ